MTSSGAVSAVNTFGDNGLLSRRDVANSLTTYYAFDPQGSAVDVMQNNNGLPAAYSAFGIPASGGASGSPFGFGAQWGYYTDAETGLILCTHRYYDPYTGRFVNRDPISYKGGVNLYNYTANNPVNESDASGFLVIESGCKEAATVKAAIQEACAKIKATPPHACFTPAEKSCLLKVCSGSTLIRCGSRDCLDDLSEEGTWDMYVPNVIVLCTKNIMHRRHKIGWSDTDETAYALVHEMLHECGRLDTGGPGGSNPAGDGANCCFGLKWLNFEG